LPAEVGRTRFSQKPFRGEKKFGKESGPAAAGPKEYKYAPRKKWEPGGRGRKNDPSVGACLLIDYQKIVKKRKEPEGCNGLGTSRLLRGEELQKVRGEGV